MSQLVKNAEGTTFQLAMLTVAGVGEVQCVALVGADGQPITAWPLPTGAATEDGQVAIASAVATLAQALGSGMSVTNFPASQTVSGTVNVGNFPATQPVSAASLPLPNGAASQATLAQVLAALQATLGVHVDNLPADYPDSSANNKLTQVLALLSDTLLVSGPLTDEQLRNAPLANPVGAASAEKQDELKALATEIRELAAQNKALLDTLLMFSVAVLEKMPILTSADAANVQLMNPSVSLSGGTLQNVSGGNLSLIPWQITPSHIYDNLHVTP